MDSQDKNLSVSRRRVLKRIASLPLVALGVGATLSQVQAANPPSNKAQFKYQTKPGPNGQKCSTCQLFIPPNKCKIVQPPPISPNGWCTAWVKKS